MLLPGTPEGAEKWQNLKNLWDSMFIYFLCVSTCVKYFYT